MGFNVVEAFEKKVKFIDSSQQCDPTICAYSINIKGGNHGDQSTMNCIKC